MTRSVYSERREQFQAILASRDPDFLPYITQWIDYEGNHKNRLKMVHDIELKDGRVLTEYRPNGSGWYANVDRKGEPTRVDDSQVKRIRLSLRQYPWEADPNDGN